MIVCFFVFIYITEMEEDQEHSTNKSPAQTRIEKAQVVKESIRDTIRRKINNSFLYIYKYDF